MATNKNTAKKSTISRKSLSVSDQKWILELIDAGTTYNEISRLAGVGPSCISNIKQRREYIEKHIANSSADGVDIMSKKRLKPVKHPELDRSLYLWYLEKTKQNIKVPIAELKTKAKTLHKNLCTNENCIFEAGNGWVCSFKKRHGFFIINANSDEKEFIPGEVKTEIFVEEIHSKKDKKYFDNDPKFLKEENELDMELSHQSDMEETQFLKNSSNVFINNKNEDQSNIDESQIGQFSICNVADFTADEQPRPTKQRNSFSIMDQKRILDLIDTGVPFKEISKIFGIKTSTIYRVKSRRNELGNYSGDVTSRKHLKPVTHPDVERSLYLWYRDQRSKNISVSILQLQKQARLFHKQLCTDEKCLFTASYGYIVKLKMRHNIETVRNHNKDENVIESPKQRISLSIIDQKRILDLIDRGVMYKEITEEFGVKATTICGIKGRREYIEKYIDAQKNGDESVLRKRTKDVTHPELEKSLYLWYREKQSKVMTVTKVMLQEQARKFHEQMCKCTFSASDNFIAQFKKRHNLVKNSKTEDDQSSKHLTCKDETQKSDISIRNSPDDTTNGLLEKPSINQRKCLSIMDQKRILELIDNRVTYSKISKKYGIKNSTVSGIKARRKYIENYLNSKEKGDATSRKKITTASHPTLDHLLYLWYKEQLSKDISLTKLQIRNQARIFHAQLCFDKKCSFVAGNNYILGFKQRFGFVKIKEKKSGKSSMDNNNEDAFNVKLDESLATDTLDQSVPITVTTYTCTNENSSSVVEDVSRTQDAISNLEMLIDYYDDLKIKSYLSGLKNDLTEKIQAYS